MWQAAEVDSTVFTNTYNVCISGSKVNLEFSKTKVSCITYFANIVYFGKCLSLRTHWQEEKNEAKYKSLPEIIELYLLSQSAYVGWEGLLMKPVANQHKWFDCDEQRDAEW